MPINRTVTRIGGNTSARINNDVKSLISTKVGFSYPVTTKEGSKFPYFSKATGLKLLRANLIQLLKTSKGERLMLPNYGTNLSRFIFDQRDTETFRRIKETIQVAISRFAPFVEIIKIGVFSQQENNVKVILILKEKDTGELLDVPVEIG